MYHKEHYDIVWVDETLFTTKTQLPRAWSQKHENFQIDMRKTNMKPIACVAAISERFGVDLMMLFEKSIN